MGIFTNDLWFELKSKRRFFQNDDLPSKLIKPSISAIIKVEETLI